MFLPHLFEHIAGQHGLPLGKAAGQPRQGRSHPGPPAPTMPGLGTGIDKTELSALNTITESHHGQQQNNRRSRTNPSPNVTHVS